MELEFSFDSTVDHIHTDQ